MHDSLPAPPIGQSAIAETLALPGGLHVRAYRGTERRAGPRVLFLHAIGMTGRSWFRVAGRLRSAGEWAALDLPGFGESDKPSEAPYSLTWQGDRVGEALDALGWDDAVLVGNSMGGGIALASALRAPERVRGLALLNTVAFPDALHWVGHLGRMPLIPALAALTTPMIARLSLRVARGARGTVDPEDGPICSRFFRDPAGRRAFFTILKAIYGDDLRDISARMGEVAPPALVVHGARDPLVPRRSSERLAAAIPISELCVFDRLGHFPQEEAPDQVAETLDAYLRQR